LLHDREHLAGLEVLEARLAEILIAALLGVLALGEDPPLHGPLQPVRLVLFEGMQVVEPVPDAVDLALDLASEHESPSV
jgi:hypothetical protein